MNERFEIRGASSGPGSRFPSLPAGRTAAGDVSARRLVHSPYQNGQDAQTGTEVHTLVASDFSPSTKVTNGDRWESGSEAGATVGRGDLYVSASLRDLYLVLESRGLPPDLIDRILGRIRRGTAARGREIGPEAFLALDASRGLDGVRRGLVRVDNGYGLLSDVLTIGGESRLGVRADVRLSTYSPEGSQGEERTLPLDVRCLAFGDRLTTTTLREFTGDLGLGQGGNVLLEGFIAPGNRDLSEGVLDTPSASHWRPFVELNISALRFALGEDPIDLPPPGGGGDSGSRDRDGGPGPAGSGPGGGQGPGSDPSDPPSPGRNQAVQPTRDTRPALVGRQDGEEVTFSTPGAGTRTYRNPTIAWRDCKPYVVVPGGEVTFSGGTFSTRTRTIRIPEEAYDQIPGLAEEAARRLDRCENNARAIRRAGVARGAVRRGRGRTGGPTPTSGTVGVAGSPPGEVSTTNGGAVRAPRPAEEGGRSEGSDMPASRQRRAVEDAGVGQADPAASYALSPSLYAGTSAFISALDSGADLPVASPAAVRERELLGAGAPSTGALQADRSEIAECPTSDTNDSTNTAGVHGQSSAPVPGLQRFGGTIPLGSALAAVSAKERFDFLRASLPLGLGEVPVFGKPGSFVEVTDQIAAIGAQLNSITRLVQGLMVGPESGIDHAAVNLAAVATNQNGVGPSSHVLGSNLIDPDDSFQVPPAAIFRRDVQAIDRSVLVDQPATSFVRKLAGDVTDPTPVVSAKKITEGEAADTGSYFRGEGGSGSAEITGEGGFSGEGPGSFGGDVTAGTSRLGANGVLTQPEVATASTPGDGFGVYYTGTDGKPYHKNSAGTETDLSTGSGGGGGVEVGQLMFWGGDSASIPSDYVIANGQELDRSTYSTLFSAVGAAHGAGDGSTTFGTPDMRNRVPRGVNNADTGVRAGNGVVPVAEDTGTDGVALTAANIPDLITASDVVIGSSGSGTSGGATAALTLVNIRSVAIAQGPSATTNVYAPGSYDGIASTTQGNHSHSTPAHSHTGSGTGQTTNTSGSSAGDSFSVKNPGRAGVWIQRAA